MKKRILFFCRFPPPYNSGQTIGTEIVYNYLSGQFHCEKIDLSFGDNIIGSGVLQTLFYPLYLVRKILVLGYKMRSSHFLYLVPGMSFQGILRDIISVWIAVLFKRKVIFHFRNANVHESYNTGIKRPILNYFVKNVTRFIFLSDHLLSSASKRIPIKSIVIPNSIDESVILSDEEYEVKQKRQADKQSVKILYISNLIESKGYLDLLKALHLLSKETNIKFECDFVGGTEKIEILNQFKEQIRVKKLHEKVFFHGIVNDRKKIKDLYFESDIFVLPTYFPLEAQPRSIIESMNAGNAVISTKHASIPEYVFEGKNGLFVQKQNPDSIKQKLVQIINDKKYLEMGKRSREIYLNQFSQEVIRKKLIEVFNEK